MTLAWVDGRLSPAEESQLSVTDRGFQLGDGIFETLRVRHGVPVEWDEHVVRLRESADVLAIPLGSDVEPTLRRALDELLEATGVGEDAAVRITVTRGRLAGRGTLPPGWREAAPTIALQAFPYQPPPGRALEQGVRAVTSSVRRDPGSPLAGVKSTSRADHVYARLEAERAGVDEAVVLTADGFVSEATSANVFVCHGERLATPPRTAGILLGTTRTWLLANASSVVPGLRAEERDLTTADVASADEALLSSSVAGIVPLVELDGGPIGSGRPGEIGRALRAARDAWIESVAVARTG